MAAKTNNPIEDYGVIGDLHTVALISTDVSIDFLCLPEFDSPTVFAALLDPVKGGAFSITPLLERSRRKQMYVPDTNILTTRHLSERAIAEVIDYMPIDTTGDRRRVIRTVRAIKGEITFLLQCCPRFDYGRKAHSCRRIDERAIEFASEEGCVPPLRLVGGVPLQTKGTDVEITFVLKAGQETSFLLECGICGGPTAAVDEEIMSQSFTATSTFWRDWVAKSKYKGRWREAVTRSALVLKLLTSRKYGSIIAAPTFGLPERPGGGRNWDYRYIWMRDAAFMLYAFMRLGYTEEARQSMLWLKNRMSTDGKDGPLQVMYRVNGDENLDEVTLEHLAGYQKSAPVRIGNAASRQLQLDIYGEVMDAVYLATKYGDGPSYNAWKKYASSSIGWGKTGRGPMRESGKCVVDAENSFTRV